jgi:uncharacterized protein
MLPNIENFQGLNITFNTNEDCNLACKYDLLEGSKILMADLSEKPIEDVKKGDIIIGFDEKHVAGKHRKLHYAIVEDCGFTRMVDTYYNYKTPSLLPSKGLFATAEHPVLNQRNRFQTTGAFYKSKSKHKKVYKISLPEITHFRERPDIEGKSFYKKHDVIIEEIHSIFPKRAFNLTTSTRTFIADGILVHNCYEINKKHKILPLDYAKRFIDIILADPDPVGVIGTKDEWFLDRGLILDFIGGDSFMHVDILDKILSYYMYTVNTIKPLHKWTNNWRSSISSNGTLFDKKEVRDFIKKYHQVLSLSISIDGCPTIHDKNRIFAERGLGGEEIGSMGMILKWWPWLKENYPHYANVTKATCSRESIPYLFESLQFMHEELGITYINQNFIMEPNGCTEKDYIMLEDQLNKCIDYIFNHRDKIFWSMIDTRFIRRLNDSGGENNNYDLDSNWCGSGAMPALGINGKIYPCFRWLPHTQEDQDKSEEFCVGDIWTGITKKENFRKIRDATRRAISPPECLKCEYEPTCSYCIGGCYSEYGCFKRTTHICEITKLQAKAADNYWKKVDETDGTNHFQNRLTKAGIK